MKHIISFSTGLSSALAVERVLQRYGKNVDVVSMDTKAEDEDNWRFAWDCQARWGKKIIVLTEGRTPRQVAEDKRIIPNQKIAPCTFVLKIDLFRNWLYEYCSFEQVTIHIGYDIFEAHRCAATQKNYKSHGWNVDFPLLWKPIEYRPYSQIVKDDWGIEPPRTYKMGFSHANCLRDGCFKMSIKDATLFYYNFPSRYKSLEDWEEMMRNHKTRKNYAILRDQSGGTVRSLPLVEMRQRLESKNGDQLSLFDNQSSACIYCGVGDLALTGGRGDSNAL